MSTDLPSGGLGRVVVVSPHLDDGVLSLGAWIAARTRGGTGVELLTVLACNPESNAPTRGWDRRAGFGTEGEAARARRREDEEACGLLGAVSVWLPFGSVDYERHGDDRAVRESVAAAVDGADVVLLPGSPLSHPDHLWLVEVLTGKALPCREVGLYAEQPYTRGTGASPVVPEWLSHRLGARAEFRRAPVGARDRLAKWRAVRRYRSQLPLLAMHRSLTRGAHVLALADEAVAVGDRADRPHH